MTAGSPTAWLELLELLEEVDPELLLDPPETLELDECDDELPDVDECELEELEPELELDGFEPELTELDELEELDPDGLAPDVELLEEVELDVLTLDSTDMA